MKYNKNFKIALNLISSQYRQDYNSVRVNTHNTLAHELKKLILAYKLIKDNKTILTEVIFRNGKRAQRSSSFSALDSKLSITDL